MKRSASFSQLYPLGATGEPATPYDHNHVANVRMSKSHLRLLLVRHAQSEANVDRAVNTTVSDHAIGLSDAGRLEATASGNLIKAFFEANPGCGAHNRRILVSPYKRTLDTAALVVDAVGVDQFRDCKERTLLAEQHFGLFEGLSPEEIAGEYPRESEHFEKAIKYNGRFWARAPMGESRFDVALRMTTLIEEILRDEVEYGICDVVIISHGVTLRAFAMEWLEKTPEWMDAQQNPTNGSVRLIDGMTDKGYLH